MLIEFTIIFTIFFFPEIIYTSVTWFFFITLKFVFTVIFVLLPLSFYWFTFLFLVFTMPVFYFSIFSKFIVSFFEVLSLKEVFEVMKKFNGDQVDFNAFIDHLFAHFSVLIKYFDFADVKFMKKQKIVFEILHFFIQLIAIIDVLPLYVKSFPSIHWEILLVYSEVGHFSYLLLVPMFFIIFSIFYFLFKLFLFLTHIFVSFFNSL